MPEIIFHGNKTISQKILAGEISGNKTNYFLDSSKQILDEKFHQLYNEAGYFHFRLDSITTYQSEDSLQQEIHLFLTEGEPTNIHKIILRGIDSLNDKSILRESEYLEGTIFTKQKIENFIEQIFNKLDEEGYPFAKIKIESVSFYTDSASQNYFADSYLSINKEKEGKIDRIEIIGNSKTKDYVIFRELGLQYHEKYSQKKINEIPKRLNRLRFFDPLAEPQFYFSQKDEGVLKIEVKEKETNNFDGIIGYLPGDTKTGSGYFSGLVNVSLRNLFGTGRAAAFRWQKIDRLSQELELKYFEPWLFDFPFHLNFGLFQKKQDSSFVQRTYSLALDYTATSEVTVSGTFDYEKVIPSLNDYGYISVYDATSISTGLTLKYDSRDDPYSPTEGMYFANAYVYTRKKISGPAALITATTETKVTHQKIITDFNIYYEPFKRQVTALGLHGKELQGSQVEISDMFLLGGTNSLRGYRENQFLASRIAWANLEYRFLLTRRTFAFSFFDVGYFLQRENVELNIPKSFGTKIGYGIGLHIETGLGILNVNFAFAKGDSFSEGKIHFGILNEF
ncbi:MAG: BamA/TamA family outer membrane protein [Ignavibacteriaceae bacterium]|nr:BamA/TamA family outer membrane protein [Ignavibacteriaceae bacterium]